MHLFAVPKLMTLDLPVPIYIAKDFTDGRSSCAQLRTGPSAGALNHSGLRIPGGKLTTVKQNLHPLSKKYPGPHSRLRDGKTFNSNCVEGTPVKAIENRSLISPHPDGNGTGKDLCGSHFLFDKKLRTDRIYPKYEFRDEMLLRPKGSVPPLPREYQVYRSGVQYCFPIRKELSHDPPIPCTPVPNEAYEQNSGQDVILPSAMSLSGKIPFSLNGCKYRSRLNNRPCGIFTVGRSQKTQSYPDPTSGASASFTQRLSEISSLEGETVRQEKIRKLKKNRRQES